MTVSHHSDDDDDDIGIGMTIIAYRYSLGEQGEMTRENNRKICTFVDRVKSRREFRTCLCMCTLKKKTNKKFFQFLLSLYYSFNSFCSFLVIEKHVCSRSRLTFFSASILCL